MSFVTACLFCQQRVRVPDGAVGASVQCRRCGNYFTLARDDDAPRLLRTAAAEAKQAAPPQPEPAVAIEEPPAESVIAEPSEPVSAFAPPPTERVAWLKEFRRLVDPVGLAALLLAAAALLCASVYSLGVLVIPTSAVGLVTGVASVVRAALSRKPRWLFPVAGTLASGAVLFVAMVFPARLGPAYQLARARPDERPTEFRAIPLAGQAADANATPEWADAARFAVQQGSVRVQVVSASIRPVELLASPKTKLSAESYLVVQVRAHRPISGAEFAEQRAQPAARKEKPAVTLTDAAGRALRQPTIDQLAESSGGVAHSHYFPVGVADEMYVFEAPPAGMQALRLEIAATAWGGSGAFRFSIPKGMIRAEKKEP